MIDTGVARRNVCDYRPIKSQIDTKYDQNEAPVWLTDSIGDSVEFYVV